MSDDDLIVTGHRVFFGGNKIEIEARSHNPAFVGPQATEATQQAAPVSAPTTPASTQQAAPPAGSPEDIIAARIANDRKQRQLDNLALARTK